GGKAEASVAAGGYPDDAPARFSGYLALDELYDGPFRALSAVDNRTRPARHDKRLRAAAGKARRLRRRVGERFDHRHLFVRRHLSGPEAKTPRRVTRGLPHPGVRREIMDEV